jgi:ABC-type transport system substrate-binding protein
MRGDSVVSTHGGSSAAPSRGLIRRDFIRRTGAAGALLASGGLGSLLSACGSGDGDGGSVVADAFPAPETANVSGVIYEDLYPELPQGGELTIGYAGQLPSSLDVLVDANGANTIVADPVHDWLEHYEPDGRLVPSLAESFELVDEVTFRYTLHKGASFHNGRPVTADDVKKTYEWVQDSKNGSFLASRIEGVSVHPIDDRTLELRLDRPNAALRAELPAIPILPVEEMDKQAREPVGCGPYVLDRFVEDSFVSYRRNPDYWNPDAPRLDTLRIDLFPQIQTGARVFLSGQADYVWQVSLTQLDDFRRREEAGELRITIDQAGWLYVGFNLNEPPYDDPKVRQAIALALDREAMVTSALSNGGTTLFFPGIARNHPWYPADLEYERDVERAKELLAEAGMPNGFSDSLLTLGDKDYFVSLNTVIQSNLRDVGIDLELEVVDIATLIDRTFGTQKFTITTLGDAISPEPSTQVDAYFRSDGGNNYFGYSNKEYDRILRRAREVYDPDERKDLYRQAFMLLCLEDFAVVPVTSEPGLGLFSTDTNADQYRPDPISRLHFPVAAKGSELVGRS